MIDNFKYNTGTGSYIYGNNTANLETYGRLYKWTTANTNKTKIKMYLPVYNASGDSIGNSYVYGALPTFQQIRDLLETTTIGNLPENGTSPDYPLENGTFGMYYDAFLAGRGFANSGEDAYHSLAGWRDNMDVAPGNTEFNSINSWGRFWTNELAGTGFHYPLEIKDETYNWTAYINAGHDDRFAFSVRYIFKPYGFQ